MGTYFRNSYNNIPRIKFSIIVPIYNVEKYLPQCLDSILSQSLKDFEVICVDDGSTDNSLLILQSFAEKDFRVNIISQRNQGVGIARNNALKEVKGKYLLFVDPDDLIDTNALELLWNKLEATEASVLQFDYAIFKDGSLKQKNIYSYKIAKKFGYDLKEKGYFNWEVFKKRLFRQLGLAVWNRVYLTDFVKENNIKFASSRIGEDHIFTIKAVILAPKIFYLNKCLYHYRKRKASATNMASDANFSAFENVQLVEKFLKEKELFECLKEEFKEYKIENLAHHFCCVPQDKIQIYIDLCKKILSQDEFAQFQKLACNVELSTKEKIFSLKNSKLNGIKYKVLTILGYSMKLGNNPSKCDYSSNKNIKNRRKNISFIGLPIYSIEDFGKVRIQKFFGGIFLSEKYRSDSKECKIFKLLYIPFLKRVVENDVCKYYSMEILLCQKHLAQRFFEKYLKNVKSNYDAVYILHANSGEIFLFFAYLLKLHLKKNKIKNPLFVITKKYHIDILKMYYPEANYLFIANLKLKTQSNVWKTPDYRCYILFPGAYFNKIEKDIKNYEIGKVHYFNRMLEDLNISKEDLQEIQTVHLKNPVEKIQTIANKTRLNVDKFVIVAPEAITCEGLSKAFWGKLVGRLRDKNFDIFLNITNPKNIIENTKYCELSFEELYILGEKAQGIISLRSGLSEFLLPTKVPNIAIYSKFKNRGEENTFSVEKGIESFSMHKLPFVNKEKIYEINAELYKKGDELVDKVIDILEKAIVFKEEK